MSRESQGPGTVTGGSLERTPLVDVFRNLFAERASAKVLVAKMGEERTFLFDRGQVITASSNREAQFVGDLLRKFGLADEKVLFQAFEKALAEPGRGLAKVLKETGAVPPYIADACVRALAERLLFDSFRWNAGNYTISNLEEVPEPPVRFDQSNASLLMEALRRVPLNGPGISAPDPKSRPVLNEDLWLRYQVIVLQPQEAEILRRVDGIRTVAEITDAPSVISQLRAVGIIQTLPASTTKKSKGEDTPSNRPLNIELIGAPPQSIEDMERHLTIVKQTYRRIDWINLYDFLGITNAVTDDEIVEAIHDRARIFHPDHSLKAPFADYRDALEVLSRRVKQAQRVFKNSESRKSYDFAQEQGGNSSAVFAGGPTRDVQLDIAKRNYHKARELYEMGDYYPAYEMIRQSVEFEPERPEYWVMLARIQRKNPKWARQASETLRRGLGKIPDNVDLLFELSECYAYERNENERTKALKEILRIDPANRRAQASLAEIASQKPGR